MKSCFLLARSLALLLASLTAATAADAPRYRLIDLGTFGGQNTGPSSINATGQITGAGEFATFNIPNPPKLKSAFLYANGSLLDLGTLGGRSSDGSGINDSGEVVGSSSLAGDTITHAFLFSGGVMRDLGTLGGTSSAAAAINASGQIAGNSTRADGQTHAFLIGSRGGMMTDLGVIAGNSSYSSAINASGQVVGVSTYGTDTNQYGEPYYHAFLYTGGPLQDLGTFGGLRSSANDINNAGQVVGEAGLAPTSDVFATTYSHAFIYTNGVMKDLTPDATTDTRAEGINNAGQIVGIYGYSRSTPSPFVYVNDQLYYLNELVEAGDTYGRLIGAVAINDAGWIAAYGYPGDSIAIVHSYLLIPLPPKTATTAPIPYAVTDLGTLGGKTSEAQALNDAGQIVGYAALEGDQASHGTLFTVSGDAVARLDLGVKLVSSGTIRINASGQIATSDALQDIYSPKAVTLTVTNGQVTRQDLPGLPDADYSIAASINAAGQIVGYVDSTAVAFTPTGAIGLGNLGVDAYYPPYASAYDINASGQVVGYASAPIGRGVVGYHPHAALFSLTGAAPVDLDASGVSSAANAINDDGQIVGYSRPPGSGSDITQATLFQIAADGTVTRTLLSQGSGDYRFTNSTSNALDINNAGQIVGEYDNGAFLYTGGKVYNLNDLAVGQLGGFTTLDSAQAINASGWIVGKGTINGQTHAFLARPSGTPAAHAPVLATAPGGNIIVGEAFAYQITTDGSVPVDSFGATGLPEGLMLDTASGLITGALPAGSTLGAFTIDVTASNGAGIGTAAVTFTAVEPPEGKAPDLTGSVAITKQSPPDAKGKAKIKGSFTLSNAGDKTIKNAPLGVYLSRSQTFSFPAVADAASAGLVPLTAKLTTADAEGNPVPPVLKVSGPTADGAPAVVTVPVKLAVAGKAAALWTAQLSVKLPVASAGGYRYLLIVADPAGGIAEPAKANNVTVIDLQAAR